MERYSAVTVLPRAPFVEWARKNSSGVSISAETLSTDPVLWIIPNLDLHNSSEPSGDLLEELKEILFPRLLSDWDPDKKLWPREELSAKLFDQWFELRTHRLARVVDELIEEFDESSGVEEGEDGEHGTQDAESEEDETGYSQAAHDAVMEAIENQLLTNNPPEAKQTYKRLVAEGYDAGAAKRLVAVVLVDEIFRVVKEEKEYDNDRYVANLKLLPKTPWQSKPPEK
jgi:hypothetical protein